MECGSGWDNYALIDMYCRIECALGLNFVSVPAVFAFNCAYMSLFKSPGTNESIRCCAVSENDIPVHYEVYLSCRGDLTFYLFPG